MFCSKCGSQVNGKFCPKCGTPVNQNVQNNTAGVQNNAAARPNAGFQNGAAANQGAGFRNIPAQNLNATVRPNPSVNQNQGYQNNTQSNQNNFRAASPVNNQGYAPVNAPDSSFFNDEPAEPKKKSVVGKVIIAIVAVLVIGLGTGAFFYFTSPETTVSNFVSAYNKMDTDKMVACIEPDARDEAKAALSLLGGNQLGALGDIMGDAKPTMSVKITGKEKVSSTETVLKGTMTIEAFGQKEEEEIEIPMVKDGVKWYIMGDSDLF